MIQAALDEVVRTRIQQRLNVTFGKDAPQLDLVEKKTDSTEVEAEVITTDDELQAFMIVRAIGSRVAPVNRITMRDAKTYCSIFVDDNNRKPICRLYFNSKGGRSIGLFDATKTELRKSIDDLSEIYNYADQIVDAVNAYL
jgi:predicted type IV restriction endonuclease